MNKVFLSIFIVYVGCCIVEFLDFIFCFFRNIFYVLKERKFDFMRVYVIYDFFMYVYLCYCRKEYR